MPITLPTEIITSDKTPRVAIAFDKTSGVKQRASTARDVLLVGQMAASGTTATVAVPYELLRETDSEVLFGKGSMLDFAAKAAFKAHPFVKLSAVAVADGGTAATTTLTFTTTATASTTYRLRIAGVLVQFNITSSDNVTTIATSCKNAVNANTSLPVTADSSSGIVTFLAKNGGTTSNGIQLRGEFDTTTAVVGTTAAFSGTAMGGTVSGSGSESITAALAACTGKRYHEIAILIPDSTAGGVAKTHTNTESDAEHGHGEFFHQVVNTIQSTATTLALALNAPRGSTVAINTSESWSVAICAAYAAVLSSEEVATRPLNTLPLVGIVPPPVEKRWTRTETRTLLDNGCSPLVVMPGETVGILRSVISGVKNAAGDFDYSTLDITITRGFDDLRDNCTLMFNTNYPRARWADSDEDGLLPPDVATPAKVKQDLIDVLRDAESRGICSSVERLKDQCVVEKVGTQCQFSIPANIVDGMHEKLGKIVLIRQTVTSV